MKIFENHKRYDERKPKPKPKTTRPRNQLRYDQRDKVTPQTVTKTRNQRYADLRADRDRQLAECDAISDEGKPMEANARRELILYDFGIKQRFLAQGFNRDGSIKSDEELVAIIS